VKRLFIAGVVLALALTGCSSGGGDKSTPEPSVSSSPSDSPSASPSPSTITREQAAKQYLALAAPGNAARDRFEKKCGFDDRIITEGGSYDKQESDMMTNLRECWSVMAKADRAFSAGLRKATWPADAQADIEKLARFNDAAAYAEELLAKAYSFEEYGRAGEKYPRDDGSADIVRARLGLPVRTK
jgi:hypothetical protein